VAGIVGIDVGGTFTDLVFSEDGSSVTRLLKVPSTPEDPAQGLLNALGAAHIGAGDIKSLLHGTTIATNAVIERGGANCALVTTRGFRDVLELGRRDRPNLYGLGGTQNPLIPRDRRFEVTERVSYDGSVLVALDPDEVRRLAVDIMQLDVESVVVTLMHSYVNPSHELEIQRIFSEVNPDWHVVVSSEVNREYYEFERTSTAVVQGYLQPLVSRYAASLRKRLDTWGFSRDILIMQSNGGVVSVDKLGERAAHIIRSGPAAGVTAAAHIAAQVGFNRIITADMGGTSFDVAVVIDGEARVAESTNLDFRIPIRIPMLDVHTIGAGGGSIAWIDRGGVLQVGPRSAGANPGPIAFRRGGTELTVTDAHVVLGRINAARPIGSDVGEGLDLEAAREAMARLGDQLGLGVEEMAEAILAVVNTRMAGRMRLISVEQGHDPRDFAMVVFGGAGPLHGAALLREVGVRSMLVPTAPGVLCALGCVLADLRFDLSRTVECRTDELKLGELEQTLTELSETAQAQLHAEAEVESVSVKYHADMAYLGQVHRLSIPIEPRWSAVELREAFEHAYKTEFGTTLGDLPLLVVNVRVAVRGSLRRGDTDDVGTGKRVLPKPQALPPAAAHRQVYFDGAWHTTPVYQRSQLLPGMDLTGPAIVEQDDTTVVIELNMKAAVDERSNLQIEVLA